MGSVTFFDQINYEGNWRSYEIGDRADSQILLYNDTITPLQIRSIKNKTDKTYIVVLYYKNGENAFGGSYINIDSDFSDLNYIYRFSKVNLFFNGVILQKKIPNSRYL